LHSLFLHLVVQPLLTHLIPLKELMSALKSFATSALGLGVAVSAVVLGSATDAQAFSFGTGGLSFDQDTTVTFNFVRSHGAFTSALKVVEASSPNTSLTTLFSEGANGKGHDQPRTSDFRGTCGNAASTVGGPCTTTFKFLAGITYSLLLDSGVDGKVFSTDSLNNPVTWQATFTGDVANGGVRIRFDDRGNNNDRDFNDFIVDAKSEATPEPSLLIGAGLVALGMATKRRQSNPAA
jgi:hypothetical protein